VTPYRGPIAAASTRPEHEAHDPAGDTADRGTDDESPQARIVADAIPVERGTDETAGE